MLHELYNVCQGENYTNCIMKRYIEGEQGKRIKEIRGKTSQPEFASKLGVSLQGYLNYEYGKRVPPGPVLAKLAEISGRSVDWILTGMESGSGANRVAERPAPYGLDEVSRLILDTIKNMDEEGKRDVLRYSEKVKPYFSKQHRVKKSLKEG